MEITRATEALRIMITNVETDVKQILNSGNYYVTEELARELRGIQNNLDHLRLDASLMASPEWQEAFNPRNSASAIAGATSALDKAAARLYDYRCQLPAVGMGLEQENNQREMHQWGMTTLLRIQEELAPYTYGATDRIRQFGDHTGVTDRYTGYRNNLTRNNDQPVKMETSYMNKDDKQGYMNPFNQSKNTGSPPRPLPPRPELETKSWGAIEEDSIGVLGKQIRYCNGKPRMFINKGYRTLDSLYPASSTWNAPGVRPGGAPNYSNHMENLRFMNDLNANLSSWPKETPPQDGPVEKSVQEQAGINTTFPGKSEYMQRYTQPLSKCKTNDFIINPRPNMIVQGRPMGKAKYDLSFTEYQTRYEWPDGEKLVRLPWMCK